MTYKVPPELFSSWAVLLCKHHHVHFWFVHLTICNLNKKLTKNAIYAPANGDNNKLKKKSHNYRDSAFWCVEESLA